MTCHFLIPEYVQPCSVPQAYSQHCNVKSYIPGIKPAQYTANNVTENVLHITKEDLCPFQSCNYIQCERVKLVSVSWHYRNLASFSVTSALQLPTPTRLSPPVNGLVISDQIQEFHTKKTQCKVSFRYQDRHSGYLNGPGRRS